MYKSKRKIQAPGKKRQIKNEVAARLINKLSNNPTILFGARVFRNIKQINRFQSSKRLLSTVRSEIISTNRNDICAKIFTLS